MINDDRNFRIDDFNDIVFINEHNKEEDIIISDLPKYIDTYIKHYEIAPFGIAVVHNNAKHNMSMPSDTGTMRNLYMLFRTYYLAEAAK